jgi:hypothetical protein
MQVTRRQTIQVLTASAVTGLLGRTSSGAPPPAVAPVRLPLEEFVNTPRMVAALRRGVKAMKKRKASDPLSWVFQAAIHGILPARIEKEAKDDPDVNGVFQKRYWNQCPHNGEESANFLPWHRAYTYYFERILRVHTEDNEFALPYWNYTDPDPAKRANRKFPKEFGIEHLDGDLSNEKEDNINPLYHPDRDFFFTGYEHPLALGRMPLLELTDQAVDISLPMGTDVFFGLTEREGLGGAVADESRGTRGLLESFPHDPIHRAVGGVIGETTGAMASPPTAGFDPIFPVHHANIDRLWTEWALMPGKKWGNFPSAYWFNERPWFFYDVDVSGPAPRPVVANEPRKNYFDHRALGIRFKYEDLTREPLRLPDDVGDEKPSAVDLQRLTRKEEAIRRNQPKFKVLATAGASFSVLNATRSTIPIAAPAKQHFAGRAQALRAAPATPDKQRMAIRLRDVRLGLVRATGFDVHVTNAPDAALDRRSPSFVGSIALFTHGPTSGSPEHHGGEHGAHEESAEFDVTQAVAAGGDLGRLSVVLVPVPLLTVPGRDTVILDGRTLEIGAVELLGAQ